MNLGHDGSNTDRTHFIVGEVPRQVYYADMDREMELRHLREAERHVVEGERRIAEQELRIKGIERGGHSTGLALELLKNFRAIQFEHVAHRDRILRELGL